MEDILIRFKEHSNKIFWIVVTILLGVWFSNEYMTTKRLVREQASVLYSNLMEQYKGLILTTPKNGEDRDNLENLQRFKSEITRLASEYEGTEYSNFARILETSFKLSKNDTSKVDDLSQNNNKVGLIDIQKFPFKRIEEEILQLITARTLAASNDPIKTKNGLDRLRNLIESSELVPVEASLSYLLSLPKEGVDQFSKFKEINELIKRKPEIQPLLESELAKHGISLPNL